MWPTLRTLPKKWFQWWPENYNFNGLGVAYIGQNALNKLYVGHKIKHNLLFFAVFWAMRSKIVRCGDSLLCDGLIWCVTLSSWLCYVLRWKCPQCGTGGKSARLLRKIRGGHLCLLYSEFFYIKKIQFLTLCVVCIYI